MKTGIATSLFALGLASVGAAAPDFSFELRASQRENGVRAAAVTVAGHKDVLPDGSSAVRAGAATPDGKYVLFVHGLARYKLPVTQLEQGWVNSSAISVYDAATGRRINTVSLDDPENGAANPRAIAISDKWIAVAHFGTHEISIIDRAAFFDKLAALKGDGVTDLAFMQGIRRRIRLKCKGPEKLAFLPDGRIAVQMRYAEAVAYVDPVTGKVEEPDLPGGVSEAVAKDPKRLGEMFFNDASICYQQWHSCASCHVDGRNDGLAWDFQTSGGGLGHPEETMDLTTLKELKADSVVGSYRGDHRHEPSANRVLATEAYIRSLFQGNATKQGRSL